MLLLDIFLFLIAIILIFCLIYCVFIKKTIMGGFYNGLDNTIYDIMKPTIKEVGTHRWINEYLANWFGVKYWGDKKEDSKKILDKIISEHNIEDEWDFFVKANINFSCFVEPKYHELIREAYRIGTLKISEELIDQMDNHFIKNKVNIPYNRVSDFLEEWIPYNRLYKVKSKYLKDLSKVSYDKKYFEWDLLGLRGRMHIAAQLQDKLKKSKKLKKKIKEMMKKLEREKSRINVKKMLDDFKFIKGLDVNIIDLNKKATKERELRKLREEQEQLKSEMRKIRKDERTRHELEQHGISPDVFESLKVVYPNLTTEELIEIAKQQVREITGQGENDFIEDYLRYKNIIN